MAFVNGFGGADQKVPVPWSCDVCRRTSRGRDAVVVRMGMMDDFKNFWKNFNESLDYAVVGRREAMWSPDRRPEDQRVYDISKTKLSWGNKAERMSTAAEQARLKQQVSLDTNIARGSASSEAQSFSQLYETDTEDEHMGPAFTARVEQMAAWSDVPVDDPAERFITGMELAEMVFDKYGKYHDVGLVQNKIRLPFNDEKNLLLALNIYPACLGVGEEGFGFRLTEEQYLEKLEFISNILNTLDQAWWVKKFLREPKRSRRGLPSEPREAFAVSLGLNESPTWPYVPKSLLEELFGSLADD
ncbi:hypothetical protein FVE85_9666 [Porphyridium purpureum]|uniref:Uncharacterized protein n=1 Tax=Porphyridium purpureum TaxID=35688 RepID=A0A5J4YJP1_PORPP|nr:hypothetical protein FVE85_9666 [Porphyridium purpureum]|eukprot:POR4997..scf246_12